jgi:hypothetical protein
MLSSLRQFSSIVLGLLTLIVTAAPGPALENGPRSVRDWEALWTNVLMRHVDEAGKIDFAALSRERGDLDRTVAFVAANDPMSRRADFASRAARLAYYINAYNALAMHGVVDSGVPDSLGGVRKFTFFYLRTVSVGGKPMTLRGLENDVIRPIGEERIHFALNCMVVSCPRLPRAAFTADKLDKQLEAATRAFIGESRNVRADPDKHELWLSAIFKFYTEDFTAHAPSLIAYVNRYRAERIPPDFKVRFLDYDWIVNRRGRTGTTGERP